MRKEGLMMMFIIARRHDLKRGGFCQLRSLRRNLVRTLH